METDSLLNPCVRIKSYSALNQNNPKDKLQASKPQKFLNLRLQFSKLLNQTWVGLSAPASDHTIKLDYF